MLAINCVFDELPINVHHLKNIQVWFLSRTSVTQPKKYLLYTAWIVDSWMRNTDRTIECERQSNKTFIDQADLVPQGVI